MSVRLATHLLQERLIPPQRIDDLLQLQVVTGGSLDTLLLEGDLLDEMHLLAAMSEAFKLPSAGKEEIDEIPERLTEIFPRAFAETYRLIPYRMVDRNLLVLVAEPPNPNIVQRIEQRLRIFIHPAITTEARLLYALQRMYGVPLGERYTELLHRLDTAAANFVDRRAPQPAPQLSVVESTAATEPPAQERVSLPSASIATAPMDLDTALRRMVLGQSRDQLIDVLLAFSNQTFQFAGLFIVVEGRLLGFRGRGDANAEYRISHLRIPLNVASMFRTVHETRGPYLGQVPASSINREVMGELGRADPKTALLVPFVIGERVAGILYADNGRRGVPSKRVADILVLATQLGRHFERLIQRKKSEVRVAMGEATEVQERAVAASEAAALEPPRQAPPISTESLSFSALRAEAARLDEGVTPLAQILPAAQPALVFEGEADDDDIKPGEEPVSAAPYVPPFSQPANANRPVSNSEWVVASAPIVPPASTAPVYETATFDPSVVESPELPDLPATAVEPVTPAPELSAKDKLAERMKAILAAAEEAEDEDEATDEEEPVVVPEESISLDETSTNDVFAATAAQPVPANPGAQKPAPSFQDIDEDNAEENLAGWESVLVDTIAQGRQGGVAASAGSDVPDAPPEPPQEMSWDHVMEAAQALEAPAPAPQLVIDEAAVLLDAMDGADPDVAARAAESLWNQHRESLADKLGPRFPGRLAIDPFASGIVLPSIGDVSLVLRLLAALGQDAVPAVLPHLDSQYPVHRLMATLFFGQVVSGKAFSKLLRRLFDEEPRVRDVAAEVLRKYKSVQGFDEGVQRIRDRLSLPVIDAQVRATEILGRLRDGKSVPLLIPLTASKRPELANATLGALMRLTAQDFGHNPKKWTEWWVKNSDRAREHWLVDGLRRKEPILRVIADEELRRATGLTFQFRMDGDKKAQEAAIRGWESWWDSEQRARMKKAGTQF